MDRNEAQTSFSNLGQQHGLRVTGRGAQSGGNAVSVLVYA